MSMFFLLTFASQSGLKLEDDPPFCEFAGLSAMSELFAFLVASGHHASLRESLAHVVWVLVPPFSDHS